MLVCPAGVIIPGSDFGVFVSEHHIVVVCEMDHNVVVSMLVVSHFRNRPWERFCFGWVVFCFFMAILSGAGLGLNRRELVRENVPSVQNLKAESNLVATLQVALAVRVAETDNLERQ